MQMSDILSLKLLSSSEGTIKRKPEETCSSFAFKSKEMEKENERRKASVWRKKGNPIQYSCLENSMEPGGLQSMELQRVGHD